MKKYISAILITLFLSTIFVVARAQYAYSTVSGETLINIQNAAGTSIDARRVKDAGDAGDALSSGLLGSGCFYYNGTNWDKCRGTIAGGLLVSVTTMPSLSTTITNTTLGVKTTQGTTFTVNQIPVTNVSTLIAATNTARYSISIRNIGTVTMYIGPSGVTTSTGFPLSPNETYTFDRNTGAIYGITSSATTAAYLEE